MNCTTSVPVRVLGLIRLWSCFGYATHHLASRQSNRWGHDEMCAVNFNRTAKFLQANSGADEKAAGQGVWWLSERVEQRYTTTAVSTNVANERIVTASVTPNLWLGAAAPTPFLPI